MSQSSESPTRDQDKSFRLVVQEPCLAKYRVPVYRELAARPGINLKLVYGDIPGISNVPPEGFDAVLVPLKVGRIGGHPIYWHRAQWDYARRQLADVLILQWDVHYASLIPALLRARKQGVPTVVWGHGYSKDPNSMRTAVRYRVSQLATAVLFYNQTAAKAFIESGQDPDRVFVAQNSLDQSAIQAATDHWLKSHQKLQEFRASNGLTTGPILLYVSRMDPDNRLELAIQAVRIMKEKFPGVQLIAIGEGEPAEMERMVELAQDQHVSDRVRFLGPIYDQLEIAPWFLSADVFCYPRNIGLSLLHALGYGLPVVTSNDFANQNPEIEALRDGENGRVYRAGDVNALVAALSEVVGDTDVRRRMSDAALKTVQDEFALSHMVDGIVAAARYCWTRAQTGKS